MPKSAESDSRGYVLLWRKFWDSDFLHERGRPFSKREAWLYLFSNLANGVERNGVPRGEFEASVRFLSRRWLWSVGKVHGFLRELERNQMIARVERKNERKNERSGEHFTICNYETYQKPSNAKLNDKLNAKLNESNKGISKQGIKEPPIDPPKEKSMKRACQFPSDFMVTPEMAAWAALKFPGVDLVGETEHFKDHHIARANTFVDWKAAWQTWIRNTQKFARYRPEDTSRDELDRICEKVAGELESRIQQEPKRGNVRNLPFQAGKV